MTIAPHIFDLPAFNAFVRVENMTTGMIFVIQQGIDHLTAYTEDTSNLRFRALLDELRDAVMQSKTYRAQDLIETHELSPPQCREVITVLLRVAIRYRTDAIADPTP